MSTRTKGSRGSRGRSRLAIRYFDDRVLLTDTHAWAYYRVPSVSYEFTTPEERKASGDWWKRERKGLYSPPASLRR